MSLQKTLFMEESDEEVADGGLEGTGIQLLGEVKEWFGIFAEKANVENRGRIGEIILLKIVVQTRPRCAEVGNTSSWKVLD